MPEVMIKRYAKLAILIVCFATFAFVVDVLSPVTPTPTMQPMVKWMACALLVVYLVISLLWASVESGAVRITSRSPDSVKSDSRLLIALICIWLF
jgi:hypothetical protein